MSTIHNLSDRLNWFSVLLLGALPWALAADFGGVLPWSKYVASLVILVVCCFALIARVLSIGSLREVRLQPSAFVPTALIGALAIYGYLQTVALPNQLLRYVSPASHSAHLQWAGVLREAADANSVSVASHDSLHSVSLLLLVATVAACSALFFESRQRVIWLMSSLAVLGGITAAIGIARMLVPGLELWSFREGGEGAPFGSFLNRNNAALGMNLGVAGGIGLLTWRLYSGHLGSAAPGRAGTLIGSANLKRFLSDPISVAVLSLTAVSLVGLAVCGSRGGLLSTVLGAAAVVWVSPQTIRRQAAIGFIFCGVLMAGFFSLQANPDAIPIEMNPSARAESDAPVMPGDLGRLTSDTRWGHWPDGLRAGLHHFPGGSGLASYGYAYLPWQETSTWRWCVHADNLWLEMFVELGLMGLLFVAGVLVILFRSDRRLRASAAPVDQGLRVSTIYVVAALLVGQFFDFGLIVPALFIPVAMLFSAFVSRASQVNVVSASRHPLKKDMRQRVVVIEERAGWWGSPVFVRERLPQCGMLVCLICISVLSCQRLRADTQAQLAETVLRHEMEQAAGDQTRLIDQLKRAEEILLLTGNPDLAKQVIEVKFQVGRLAELRRLNAGRLTSEDQIRLARATGKSHRRLGWRASVPSLAEGVSDRGQPVPKLPVPEESIAPGSDYGDSLLLAYDLIRQRPLALEPRMSLVVLEFVHQETALSRESTLQASKLFRNTPEIQLRLGTLLADQGDFADASIAWAKAAGSGESMKRRALGRASKYPGFPLDSVDRDDLKLDQTSSTMIRHIRGDREVRDAVFCDRDDPSLSEGTDHLAASHFRGGSEWALLGGSLMTRSEQRKKKVISLRGAGRATPMHRGFFGETEAVSGYEEGCRAIEEKTLDSISNRAGSPESSQWRSKQL